MMISIPSREEFLTQSFADILEMGRELFCYVQDPRQGKALSSIGKKVERMKEDSGRLNFKKMEEVSHLLENIFYYASIEKIPVDEQFSNICQRASNLCCDLLNSIESSGVEKSKNYKEMISDMMKYLESNTIGEHSASEHELFNASVFMVEDGCAPDEESDAPVLVNKFDDGLVDAMGELAWNRTRLIEHIESKGDWELLAMGRQLDDVAKKLQNDFMAMKKNRMKEILNQVGVEARGMAERQNKKVRWDISGHDTLMGPEQEVSSAVLKLLLKLIKNILEREIEDEKERLIWGKNPEGTVTIKAYNETGRVYFEVRDDGRGTMKRPAGWDASKKGIEGWGGSIDVTSVEHEGTIVTIDIPLKSGVMSGLILKSGTTYFCVNQQNAIGLEQVDKKSFEYIRGMEFYRREGEALPVVRLNKFFNLEQDVEDGIVVIVGENEKRFGIVADAVCGHQEVVVNSLEMDFDGQEIYMGAAVVDDGAMALVLDLAQLFKANWDGKRINVSRKVKPSPSSSEKREKMLLFKLENEKTYGIPLAVIKRFEKFEGRCIEWSGKQAVIRYGKKVLPILNLDSSALDGTTEIFCIVVEINGVDKGFMIRNVLDVRECGGEEDFVIIRNPARLGDGV